MMTLSPFFLAATLPGFLAYADDPGPRVQVSLAIGKARYVVGEPVDVRVTFTNKEKRAVEVLTFYPMFKEVSVKSTDLVAGGGLGGGSLSSTSQTIEPGKSWSTRFFLQLYVKDPKPGRHSAQVMFQVQACYPEDFPDGPMATLEETAEVRFRVEPARPGELAELLKPYADAMKRGQFDDDWSYREAREALSVTKDPAVIPFLIDLLPGLVGDGTYQLLDQFRNREEGRIAVVKLLRSDDGERAAWALMRLADWHHLLAVEDVRPFLESAKAWPRSQALRYLREVRDARFRVFRPEVQKLAESADLAEAMLALAVLGDWDRAAAAIPARLSRAVAALDAAKGDEVRQVLEAAAAWRLDVGRSRLEALLKDRKSALANSFTVEGYAKAMDRADYLGLARKATGGPALPR